MIVLKIILWVILSILALLIIAVFIPVRLYIEYKSEVTVVLKYLFFKIPLVPQKSDGKKKSNRQENKSAKNKQSVGEKKEESETKKYIKNLYKGKGLNGFIRLIKETANLASGTMKGLFKHIIFKKFDVNITVASGDAADTAIKYGYVCAGVYPALSLLLNTVRYKDYTVDINTDFDGKESVIDCKLQANILPVFAVAEAVKLLFRFMKLKKNNV